jgi:hypothetical protein
LRVRPAFGAARKALYSSYPRAEATAAATAGNAAEAAEKGRTVQTKANELKTALGTNEQVASTETNTAG